MKCFKGEYTLTETRRGTDDVPSFSRATDTTEPFPRWTSQFDNISPCLIRRLLICRYSCRWSARGPGVTLSIPYLKQILRHLASIHILQTIHKSSIAALIYASKSAKEMLYEGSCSIKQRTPSRKALRTNMQPGTSCESCLFPLALCLCYSKPTQLSGMQSFCNVSLVALPCLSVFQQGTLLNFGGQGWIPPADFIRSNVGIVDPPPRPVLPGALSFYNTLTALAFTHYCKQAMHLSFGWFHP